MSSPQNPSDLASLLKASLGGLIAPQLSPSVAVSLDELDARRIRLHPKPEKPVAVFSLKGQGIATAGNLMVIQSQAKMGKSAVVGALIASLILDPADEAVGYLEEPDLLGFSAELIGKKAVVLFDTEQSLYDSWRLIHRACDRAQIKELPEQLRAYQLVDIPTTARRGLLHAEAERASNECGGIHAILIDGVGDLCLDPNDPAEAFEIVEDLQRLAVTYDCPVVLVIHENPSSVDGKTRGHLGSHLTRKAETNLRLARAAGADSTTEIYTEVSRNCSIPKGKGVLFTYDKALGRHVTVKRETQDQKDEATRQGLVAPLKQIFDGAKTMQWKQLRDRIGIVIGTRGRTTERRLAEFERLGLVGKDDDGFYHLQVDG